MNAIYGPILRWKFWVLLLSLVMLVVAALGAKNLVFRSDYKVFFDETNPQLQAFERMQKTFAKSDNLLYLITPEDGNVFTPETLTAIHRLTEQSWQLPYSIRVDSITNYQHTFAEEDDLIVEDLVLEPDSLDATEIARIREVALNEPLLVNRLVSPSGHVAAVNVTFQMPGKNLVEEFPEVAQAARELRDRLQAEHPGLQMHLSGMVMMNTAFSEASLHDSATLVPLMFLVVILLIGVLVRTLAGVVATLVVIVASIAAAMGLAGWAGLYLTGPSASAPTIILTLAVADCVHILTTFYHEMRSGLEKREALLSALKINTQPVVLTSVTTAIGFLSLNFSDSPPFHDLGNIVATGVMIACLLSLILLPALLMILPVRVGARQNAGHPLLDRLAGFVIAQRRPLLLVCTLLVAVMAAQIPRNELNDNFVEYFDKSVAFRQAADYSNANLTGLALMEIELESGQPGGISNPEFLAQADAFVQWMRQHPLSKHVDTLTDTFKRLNRNLHADDPAFYRLPESRELAAQYLLLYEMSLPYGLDLNNQINIDKSAMRIVANFDNLSSNEIIALESAMYAWLDANAPAIQAAISSPPLMFSHIGHRNIKSMLMGTLFALVLISALLGFALRSARFGLISLVPNLVPAAISFGIWGLFVGEVGLALSVVTGMTLGIIVDDTVHFLSKYLHARRQRDADAAAAIHYAFNSVGRALIITTVVLALGFMVLAQSTFKVNGDMGLLTAITIVIALIMDFLLLPAILMATDDRADRSAPIPASAEKEAP